METTSNKRIRLTFYFVGLFIMTLGIVTAAKSGLGVPPIGTIPYSGTVVWGIDLGLASIIFSIIVVGLQMLILRDNYKQLLWQIPVSIVFGLFLTFSGELLNIFPNPTAILSQTLLMLLSTVLVAFGIFLYIPANYIPQPPEGLVLAITAASKAKFPMVKILSDVAMVLISLAICMSTIHKFGSIGIGTFVAAVLVGIEIKVLTRLLGAYRDNMLNAS